MLVKGNYHWFSSDFVTWSCWLREIIIDFPQTLSLGYWFPFDFVTWSNWLWLIIIDSPQTWSSWSCWLREIIIDFPHTLSRGHVGYGKLSLIFLRLCHVVRLVMGNYHWFPSNFVTWVLISLRHRHLVMLVMVNYHWFPSDFVTWSFWLWLIIIDFPQILSLGYVGMYGIRRKHIFSTDYEM